MSTLWKASERLRRFRCPVCKKTYTEPHRLTLGEMYVNEDKAILAIRMLLEGNSIRSTMRITGVDQNTIMKMLALAGERCEKVVGRLIVNVPVKDVECDEIWGFVHKKVTKKRAKPTTRPSATPIALWPSSETLNLF